MTQKLMLLATTSLYHTKSLFFNSLINYTIPRAIREL